jgi:hypothetical protein
VDIGKTILTNKFTTSGFNGLSKENRFKLFDANRWQIIAVQQFEKKSFYFFAAKNELLQCSALGKNICLLDI